LTTTESGPVCWKLSRTGPHASRDECFRLRLEVEQHGRPVTGGAVVEHDVGAQGDGPARVLGIGGDRLCQVGRPPTVRVMMVSGSKTVRAYMTPTSSNLDVEG